MRQHLAHIEEHVVINKLWIVHTKHGKRQSVLPVEDWDGDDFGDVFFELEFLFVLFFRDDLAHVIADLTRLKSLPQIDANVMTYFTDDA